MKTIGLIGGMSPQSTVFYYKTLNSLVNDRYGGHASAKILLHSVNFAETHAKQTAGEWDGLGHQLAEAARGLERAGADIIALATNTMHKCAPSVEAATPLPFLHIADATAMALTSQGRKRPALLGTRFTMMERFYIDRLNDHGLEAAIPNETARGDIDRTIFDELVRGIVQEDSRERYVEIVRDLKMIGADSVILGCTEIGMLLNHGNSPLPPFDTAFIHCQSLISAALS
ncbi:MAG: aspartate/glutamate racemase family protein [Pseudomonadota bacterium]